MGKNPGCVSDSAASELLCVLTSSLFTSFFWVTIIAIGLGIFWIGSKLFKIFTAEPEPKEFSFLGLLGNILVIYIIILFGMFALELEETNLGLIIIIPAVIIIYTGSYVYEIAKPIIDWLLTNY